MFPGAPALPGESTQNDVLKSLGRTMLQRYKMVREVAREISEAANGAFDAYLEGRVGEEPQITDRILGAVEDRIRTRRFGGVAWQARTLRTGRGQAAEEKRHGADLMGVLDVDLPNYDVKKGFLAQAKRAEPGVPFGKEDWKRLISQCEKMIKRTSDSFVFVYSKKKRIRVFPAISVLGSGSMDIFDLYHHGMQNFFENHLECFIGDRRLDSTDIRTLDVLADFPARRVLHLTARMSE